MKKIVIALLSLMLCTSVFAKGVGETAQTINLDKYPSEKTITFIVNRPPGGSTDKVARAVATSLQKDRGYTTVVINYDGGDGLIGVTELMNSAPDGYTFSVIGCTEIPNMLANFEEVTFKKEDVKTVCQVSSKSRILVCRPGTPYSTLQELKEYATAHPGEVTCAVPGSSTMYLADIVGDELGVKFTVINAGGGNNAFIMTLGGHSDIAIIGSNFYRNAKAENLTILGDSMPVDDLGEGFAPTFKSMGVNFTDTAFNYIFAPKGTPDEYLNAMSDIVGDLMANGSLSEGLKNAGEDPVFMGFEEFKPFASAYIDKMIEIRKK